MTSVNVEILSNNKPFKEFKEPIDFAKKSLNEYVNLLHSMQKNVNSALTEIVEQEKLNQSATEEIMEENDDDEDEDSDADEKPLPTAKRKVEAHKDSKRIKTT
ncbi:hypothetical protein ILUMI_00667 [Ignelater luminosus]|uniref:EKC/KEOPS complex subunit GON7 n=1 Tax=Ignelater luminosus TaxID=2038154 RepID=A0A8K0DJR1_IGNLU|nr:hypothetical protein ILUMI_00667 [Ignelater luminosus]